MPRGYEFDQIHPDTPLVMQNKLSEELVPVVAAVRAELSEESRPVSVTDIEEKIGRLYRGIHPRAIRIAIQNASQANLLDFDEAMGEVHPPQQIVRWHHRNY